MHVLYFNIKKICIDFFSSSLSLKKKSSSPVWWKTRPEKEKKADLWKPAFSEESMLGTFSLYDGTQGKTLALIIMIALWLVGPWSTEAYTNKPTLPISYISGFPSPHPALLVRKKKADHRWPAPCNFIWYLLMENKYLHL